MAKITLDPKIRLNKPIDITKLVEPYENKWVALSLDHKKVLGAGETLKEAKTKAKDSSNQFLLLKLPPFNIKYAPSFWI